MEQLKTYFYSLSISKRIGILVLGILILSLPLVIVISQQVQETRQRASELPATPASPPFPTEIATLTLSPSELTIAPQTNFNVDLMIDPKSSTITGVELELMYNADYIQTVDFISSSYLNNILVNTVSYNYRFPPADRNAVIGRYVAVDTGTSAISGNQPVKLGTLILKGVSEGIGPLAIVKSQYTTLNSDSVNSFNLPVSRANYRIAYMPTATPTLTPLPTSTPTPVPPTPTPIVIKGDANGDGLADIIDYNIWRDEFLGRSATKRADFNKDGKVDLADFAIWRNAFNPNPTPTQPPQQSYKRVFITSTAYDGNLGGLTGADAKCQERANYITTNVQSQKIAGGATWKAWLSDSKTSAASRLTHFNGPYKLINNDEIVANNWGDLTDGSLQFAIWRDEFGTPTKNNTPVWTNTGYDGLTKGSGIMFYSCGDWTSKSRTYSGGIGITSREASWTDATNANCEVSLQRLYCFEQ